MLARAAWGNHPLGKSILGTRRCILEVSRDDLLEFMRLRYTPDKIVISAAGNLVHEQVVENINTFFGALTGSYAGPLPKPPSFQTKHILTTKSTEQAHFCIGTRGFSQAEPDRYPSLSLIPPSVAA